MGEIQYTTSSGTTISTVTRPHPSLAGFTQEVAYEVADATGAVVATFTITDYRGDKYAWKAAVTKAEDIDTEAYIAKTEAPKSDRATDRQVSYILSLLGSRTRSGEEGGFMSGPTTAAGVRKLTRQQASTYITSLKGQY